MTITHRTAGPVRVVPTEATEEIVLEAWDRIPEDGADRLDAFCIVNGAVAAADPSLTADLEATVRALRDCANHLQSAAFDQFSDRGILKEAAWEKADPTGFARFKRARAALAAWELTDEQ